MEQNQFVKRQQHRSAEVDQFGRTPLMNAIVSHDYQLALELIASGVNVNESDILWQTALYLAVSQRAKVEIVEQLIKNGANVNTDIRNGFTPLMCAASKGNLEITTALIQANANVNATDEYGRTALFEAICQENKEIVELLIKKDADVNVSCTYNYIKNYTPLMCAASKGNLEITTALIQANANVNATDEYGRTALIKAVARENMEIVELLIKKDADVNVSCTYNYNKNYTPLMCAVSKGNLEITTALIQANANVNATDEYGRTALFEAVAREYKEIIIELLIKKDADVNVSCTYNYNKNYTPLMCAVSKGNLEITTALIQANANVNATDEYGRTALFEAIGQENKEIVELLIKKDANVNVSCTNSYIKNYTPLKCAIAKGNLEITTALIQANANVNATNEYGRTALFEAVAREYKEIVELLIKKDADVNVSCTYNFNKNYTPLMCAVSKGNLEITTALIQANANVNATDKYGRTALFEAVASEYKEIVELLIKKDADVNVSCTNHDINNYTLLMCAAFYGNLEITTALIQANANVNATDEYGRTALFEAVAREYKEIVELLIENDADVNVSCTYNYNKNYTPLMCAVFKGNLEITTALIQANANVNATDEYGRTALFEAVAREYKEIIELLIKKDADVNVSCTYNFNKNYTPLMCAVSKGNLEITTALIQANANVNATDEYGRTTLFEAIDRENKEIVELLIEKGADVELPFTYRGIHGCTLLMYAAEKGNIKIMRLLLQHGAKVNSKDIKGRSPLFYAVSGNHPSETAYFLHENGAALRDSDKYYFSALSFCIEKLCDKTYLSESDIEQLELFKECYGQANFIFSSIINMLYNKLPTFISGNIRNSNNFLRNGINMAKKYASKQKHKKLLKKLLKKLCIRVYNVVINSFQEILDILIQLGADANSVDSYGNTALHYALELPYGGASEDYTLAIISKLEEHGSRFDIRNHRDHTPLLHGLSIWNFRTVKEIDDSSVEFYETLDKLGSSSRFDRRNWNNFKAMKEVCQISLSKCNWYTNETGGNGESVFHIILSLFRDMLNKNDVESQDIVLQDLLLLFKSFSPPHIIQGVTVNKRDNKLKTPLYLWASLTLQSERYTSLILGNLSFEGLLKEIFAHLQACGIQLNDRDSEGQTPLHCCRTWSAVKCLVQAGANQNDKDLNGRSPLLVAAHNEIFKVKEGCFFPDVTDESKSFFKQCVKMGLDLWSHDNDGASILSLLLSSNSFVLAQGLVKVSCELKPSVVEQLLLALCKDKDTHTLWKSTLVSSILKCPTRSIEMDLCPSLRSCCLNIKRLSEMSKLHLGKEKKTLDETGSSGVDSSVSSVVSVHLDIANQLRLYGANSECCQDLCEQNIDVRTLLTGKLDLDQAPLIIPWTSYSEKHKEKLERVARRQNVVSVNAYWYHEECIGSGAFGDVFAGICDKDGREVAIKKIAKRTMTKRQDKREIINLTALADCPQVVKYIYFDDNDKDSAYVVLELMEGPLDGYFASFPFELHQSISLCKDLLMGVKYLHDRTILHRDLKPGNILYKAHPKLCLKIADFGLSSPLTATPGTTVLGTNAGTRCWIAPEVLSFHSYQHTQKSDNYSCGLLLHYILSPQRHPFSPLDCSNKTKEVIEIKTLHNMMNNTMEGWDGNVSPEATHLIKGLLSKNANERPSAADSVSHPLFWTNKKKQEFLYAVGNQPEIERPLPRIGPLRPVESDLQVLVPAIVKYPTWDDARYIHMPAIYAEMTKPIARGRAPPRPARKYNTGSVVELIRFVRNTISHVSEASRPPAIRQQILEDAVFLDYFPDLVMEVYKVVIIKHGWNTRLEIQKAISTDDI